MSQKVSSFHTRSSAELLKSLRSNELKLFSDFLNSAKPGIQKVWKVVRRYYPDYLVTDEEVKKKAGGSSPLTDGAYRVLLTEINDYTKQFILVQELKNNQLQQGNILAYGLLKRGAKKAYKKHKHQIEKQIETIKPNIEYYKEIHLHKYIDYQFTTVNNFTEVDDSLQQASDYNDFSYLLQKIRYFVIMRNRLQIVKQNYFLRGEELFIDYFKQFPVNEFSLIQSYYLLLRLFQNPSRDNLDTFLKFFLPIRHEIELNETRQLLTFSRNICLWNIQSGQLDFLEDKFELSRYQADEGLLDFLGHFSHNHFLMCLNDALEAGKLDWAKDFLDRTIPKLHPDYQINLKLLGWASYYFVLNNSDLQSKFMIKMSSNEYQFTDYYNELAFRVLSLKTDFIALGSNPTNMSIKVFKAKVDGFLRFCDRKEPLNEKLETTRINFGKAVRLLFNKCYGKKRIEYDIKEKILTMQPISELPWLLSII